MESKRDVRVRFAPSPTGALHVGGVRTALFNYLFARRMGGQFILRIEDTDRARLVPWATDYIAESLQWLGIRPDEGPRIGGDCGPYVQSERADIYKEYADRLVALGSAYYAFDTAEELAAKRAEAEAAGGAFAYGPKTRAGMRNALSLPAEEVSRLLESGAEHVVRFKIPAGRRLALEDIIRGHVEVETNTLDDKVLYKSGDRMPTYHLANVVDDHLMRISHVIRGEEWLPSLPLHYLLYEAFGWLETMPSFAHLPLILKPTGKGKLSKRDGQKGGFPVFPLDYELAGETVPGFREAGYLAESLVNYLALLGWSPEDESEVLTLAELGERFTLERVSKSGARFDPERAKWFSHQWVERLGVEEVAQRSLPFMRSEGMDVDGAWALRALMTCGTPFSLLTEAGGHVRYLLEAPTEYDAKAARKQFGKAEVVEAMLAGDWSGVPFPAQRLALVGALRGAPVDEIRAFLGEEESLLRLKRAGEWAKNNLLNDI